MRIGGLMSFCGAMVLLAGSSGIAAEEKLDAKSLNHSASRETSRPHENWLREARAATEAGNFSEAVSRLRKVLDTEPAFLSRQAGYLNSHSAAHRLLETFPADSLRRYENQFGVVAQAKFSAARQRSDFSAIAKISQQYRFTQASRQALRFLAVWHFDHGDYLSAIAAFQALSEHPQSEMVRNPRKPSADVARWAAALERLGLSEEAERIAEKSGVKFRARESKNDSQKKASSSLPSNSAIWKRELARPDSVKKRLQQVQEDLEQRGFVAIPSSTPIVTKNHVIARGLKEIVAFDWKTGSVRWRKPTGSQTVELAQNDGLMANPKFQQMIARQLAVAAFADRNAGTITTDGSRVFAVLSDHAHDGFVDVPAWNLNRDTMTDWNRRRLSCCQLIAWDIATGEELWRKPEVLAHRDPAMPKFSGRIRDPQPGRFFFGPPLPLGDSLYLVGQEDREIRLFVLAAETGETRWSLPLANSGVTMLKDAARRHLACPVVAAGGLLLCPTGAGALAAVDPHSRACRWIFRYQRDDIPKVASGAWPGREENTHASLNRWWTGWRDVRIVAAEKTALLISPESDRLHAVSLQNGEPLWSKPRGDGLFLANAGRGRVLVIGRQSVRLLEGDTGQTIWNSAIPTPAGRGSWSTDKDNDGRRYLLPLDAGGFVELSLAEKTSRRTFPSDSVAGGNLVVDGDAIFMQTPSGLERRGILTPDGKPPTDAAGQFAWAQRQREAGRFRNAAGALNEIVKQTKREASKEALSSRATAELRETLLAEIATHPDRAANLVTNLEPLLASAEHRIRGWRAVAEAEQSSGNRLAALKAWLKVMAENPAGMVTHPGEPSLEIAYSRFLQGRIADLLDAAKPHAKQQLKEHLAKTQKRTLARRDPFAVSRFAGRFDQLKWGRELIVQERYRTGIGQSALEKELALWSVIESGENPSLQAMAYRRLAEERLAGLKYRDAAFFYRELQRRFPRASFSGGESVAEFIESLPEDSPVREHLPQAKDRWPTGLPRIEEDRRGKKQPSWLSLSVEAEPGSLCAGLDIWLDARSKRLRFSGGDRGGSWELKFADSARTISQMLTKGRGWGVGPVLIMQYGTDLLGIAPLDDHGDPRPRVLWRAPMVEGENGQSLEITTFRRQQLPPGFGQIQGQFLDSYRQTVAEVGPVTAGYLAYQSGGRITALEPATGKKLWSRGQLPSEATTTGDASHVVLIDPHGSRVIVLRALDGCTVATRKIPKNERVLTWWGCRALLQEESGKELKLSLWDAVTNRTIWQLKLPAKTLPFQVDSQRWGTITPDGKLSLRMVKTGKILNATNLRSVKNASQVHAIVDETRIYLAIAHENPQNTKPQASPIVDDRPIGHPLVVGSLHALDRQTGRALWQTDWGHWAIPLEQPATGPVLVLHHHEKSNEAGDYSLLRLLDQRTGKELYSGKLPETQERPRWFGRPDHHEFVIDAFQRTIRLRWE